MNKTQFLKITVITILFIFIGTAFYLFVVERSGIFKSEKEKECVKKSGVWIEEFKACTRHLTDKICTDSSQCNGEFCIGENKDSITGRCGLTGVGCHEIINNGITGTFCVDPPRPQRK